MILNSPVIALITVGCITVGLTLGILLQKILPQHHLDEASKDTVKLGAGMLATLTALVLGLLVSSAKNSFDSITTGIAESGTKIIMLDHVLAIYGPETSEVRAQLRHSVESAINRIWSDHKSAPAGLRAVEAGTETAIMEGRMRQLKPQTPAQQLLLEHALEIGNEMSQTRLLLVEQQQHTLPPVFLILLISWLTILFLSFGLFSPRNGTVLTVLIVCALSVASAIFLILEMDRPLDGFIKVSDAPLRKALELIGK